MSEAAYAYKAEKPRNPKRDPLLELKNICVEFDGFKALTDVSTNIMPNEIHFFIGPNGAGKTTLLDVICGKTKPVSGRAMYHDGSDLTRMREFEIVHKGIGRKFQAPSVFVNLTVLENMELSLRGNKGVFASFFAHTTAEQSKEIDKVLTIVDLLDYKQKIASSLSHGQKQWLEIAMLMLQSPEILLLDEPVAGMGKPETRKTGEILREIAKRYSVCVVEHDMEFVRDFAERVTVMHEGKVLVEGSVDDALNNETVKAVYLGRGGEEEC